MAHSRKKNRKRKLCSLSRKLRNQRTYNKRLNRGKGIRSFSRSPIPPLPIPPPQVPSPLVPLLYLPIPPPPNPLEARPTRRKKRWPRYVSFAENLKK